jgi:hypothetical protein
LVRWMAKRALIGFWAHCSWKMSGEILGAGVMRRFTTAAVILASVTCGCSKGTTVVTDDAIVTVEQREGKAVITSREADGTVTTFSEAGVALPDAFSKDIPLYPGATPVSHTTVKSVQSILFVTADGAAEVAAFYKEKLKGEGWKREAEVVTDRHASLTSTKDNRTLTIVAAQDDGGTHLILTLNTKK